MKRPGAISWRGQVNFKHFSNRSGHGDGDCKAMLKNLVAVEENEHFSSNFK